MLVSIWEINNFNLLNDLQYQARMNFFQEIEIKSWFQNVRCKDGIFKRGHHFCFGLEARNQSHQLIK